MKRERKGFIKSSPGRKYIMTVKKNYISNTVTFNFYYPDELEKDIPPNHAKTMRELFNIIMSYLFY